MQANDFEKMVSSQMEDFYLKPNDEVWENVAKRIRPEKKRRAFIFWLFPALLLIGTGIYFVATHDNLDKTNFNSQNKAREVKADENGTTQLTELENDSNPKKENALTNQPVHLKNTPSINLADNEKSDFRNNSITQLQKTKAIEDGRITTISRSVKNEISVANQNKEAKNNVVESNAHNEQSTNETPLMAQKSDASQFNGETHPKLIDSSKTPANTMAPKIEKPNSNNKKWKFSFTGLFGISNMMVKDNSNLSQFGSNTIPTSGSFSQARPAAKSYTPAFSPGVGIQIQKQLSGKLSLSLGANYHLYNANTKVGLFVDSSRTFYDSVFQNSISVNSYYKRGNNTNHKEQYHFIQLPVNISYQLNKNINKPVLVYGGITPGILIASNSLIYNGNADGYYRSKTQLRKWNLAVQSGVSFPIVDSKSFAFQLGPEVHYQLMSTIKPEYSTNEKLFFIGVKANLILKK